ncbi:MAG: sigma-54-dependent transcriptional regulator [Gemmataceae bacterium]
MYVVNHILVVDDEQAVCWALSRALEQEGQAVDVAASAEEAFEKAEQRIPDAIVLDVRLPGLDGLSALSRLREISNNAPVIVITAHGNLNTAVRAVENGAFDYLAKPFDLDQCLDVVHRALQRRATQRQASCEEQSDPEAVEPPEDIVGRSAPMQGVFKRIALVAARDSCVLITGESGTGKEIVAQAIHRYSSRQDGPFLPVHIAALNPNLVESELFGHARGAFTGATQAKTGLLALAEGGTIFFDELAEVPLPVQVKLLRVLEQGEVYPVGAKEPQPLDIRILAATNQDLEEKVQDGSFRHDLFFRLNVFRIHLPPLRDRREDVVPLANHFLQTLDPGGSVLPEETMSFLQAQPWVGNVRELRNALEHAVIVARGGPLLPSHFPNVSSHFGNLSPAEQLGESVRRWLAEQIAAAGEEHPTDLHARLLECVESALLQDLMKRVQGNRWVAAQWLGLNRATVRKKLAAYELTDVARESDSDLPKG